MSNQHLEVTLVVDSGAFWSNVKRAELTCPSLGAAGCVSHCAPDPTKPVVIMSIAIPRHALYCEALILRRSLAISGLHGMHQLEHSFVSSFQQQWQPT